MTSATIASEPHAATPAQMRPAYFTLPWWLVTVMLSGLTLNVHLEVVTHRQSLGVMIFLLAFGPLIMQAPHASVLVILRWLPASLLGALALVSTFWSEAPTISLRLALMLLITIWASLIIADRLRPSQFIGALFVAFFITVAGSLGSDRQQASTDGVALVGLTGSKNVLAYNCQIVLFAGLAMLLDSKQPLPMRLLGLLAIPISTVVMVLAKSASAFVLTGVGLVVFAGLLTFRRLRPVGRVLVMVAALIVAAPVIANWPTITQYAEDFQTDVLKKDKTFTGRTYLWDRAEPVIQSRPILGHGYSAYWRPGALDAEGLWRWAGVRGGFNFHNEYIEMAVGLGYVGVVVLILYMLAIGGPIAMRVITKPSVPMIFFAAIVTMMYIRTTVEVGIISAWVPQTIALFAAGVYAVRGERAELVGYPSPGGGGQVSTTPPSTPGTSG